MHTTVKDTALRPQLVVAATLAATALLGGAAYAASPGTSSVSATSQATPEAHLTLQPSSPALAACFPHARARVDVDLTTDAIGKDRFTITARGMRPRTDFTVFLIEKPGAPFGAAEYIGDFTTNRRGRATNTYNLIVEEAFAFNNETHTRTDLNSVGVWFADPKDDNGCLGAGSPVTGFDGDASAGVQMLNSGAHVLP
jgi:hypothetical protein